FVFSLLHCCIVFSFFFFFFFQAEDGIRDRNVTGVQTCALPIFVVVGIIFWTTNGLVSAPSLIPAGIQRGLQSYGSMLANPLLDRSEERRVGKECRCQWST